MGSHFHRYTYDNINNQQDEPQQHQQQHQHHGSNININQIHSIIPHSTGNNTSFLAQLKLETGWFGYSSQQFHAGNVSFLMSVKPSQLEIRTCCLECWSPGLSCFFVFKESISWLLVVNAAMIFDLEGWRGSMLYNCTCGFEKKHQGKCDMFFSLVFPYSSFFTFAKLGSGWGVTMLRNAATSPGTEMFAYTLHCTVVVGSHRMGQTWVLWIWRWHAMIKKKCSTPWSATLLKPLALDTVGGTSMVSLWENQTQKRICSSIL